MGVPVRFVVSGSQPVPLKYFLMMTLLTMSRRDFHDATFAGVAVANSTRIGSVTPAPFASTEITAQETNEKDDRNETDNEAKSVNQGHCSPSICRVPHLTHDSDEFRDAGNTLIFYTVYF